jgi:membrane associated rhomboid family serine protease
MTAPIMNEWDTPEPVLPQKVSFPLDVMRANLRTEARNTVLGGLALVGFAFLVAIIRHDWSLIFINVFFVFGGVAIAEGIWRYVTLRHYAPEVAVSEISVARFSAWLWRKPVSGYTLTLAGCLIVVAVAQSLSNFEVEAAGLVKPAFWHGQSWRVFTATLMHANAEHFLLNVLVLVHLAKIIENTIHRAFVPWVFLSSSVIGSVFSVLLYPNSTSVGASGGLMGLLGFITMAAYFDRTKYPPRYFWLMIEAIASVGVLGLLGFAFIDNGAHFGGLVCGLWFGWLCFRNNGRWIRDHEKLIKVSGAVSLFALTLITAYAVQRLLS